MRLQRFPVSAQDADRCTLEARSERIIMWAHQSCHSTLFPLAEAALLLVQLSLFSTALAPLPGLIRELSGAVAPLG